MVKQKIRIDSIYTKKDEGIEKNYLVVDLYGYFSKSLEEKGYNIIPYMMSVKKVKYVDTSRNDLWTFQGETLSIKRGLYDFKEGDIILFHVDVTDTKAMKTFPYTVVWRITKVGKDSFEYEELMEVKGKDWIPKIKYDLAKLVNK
jgi:hypothetical protein